MRSTASLKTEYLTSTTRDTSLDCVGGIMTLSVIISHCLAFDPALETSLAGKLLYDGCFLCMIPWFFFKGGMFFSNGPIAKTLLNGLSRLMLPYVAISLLSLIVFCAMKGLLEGTEGLRSFCNSITDPLKRTGAVFVNTPLWFLLSLFLVRLFFALSQSWGIPNLITLIVSFTSSYFLYRINLPIGSYFENIALGLSYFTAGNMMKDRQYHDSFFLLSIAFCLVFIIYSLATDSVSGVFMHNSYTPFFLTNVYSFLGCCLFNNLFKRYSHINAPMLAKIGKASMSYYVFHYLIIGILVYLNMRYFFLSSHVLIAILVSSLAILLPLLARLFSAPSLKWAVGDSSLRPELLCESRATNRIIQFAVSAVAIVMIAYETAIGMALK